MGSTATRRTRARTTVLVLAGAAVLGIAAVVVVTATQEGDTPVAFGDAQPLPAPVEVVVTAAEWSPGAGAEVAGYVSGIVEDGGECTLTLENGDVRLEASRPATADATTTACGWLQIDDPQVTSGTWVATLRYQSATTASTSPETPLDVR